MLTTGTLAGVIVCSKWIDFRYLEHHPTSCPWSSMCYGSAWQLHDFCPGLEVVVRVHVTAECNGRCWSGIDGTRLTRLVAGGKAN